jgi:hypothetical protein
MAAVPYEIAAAAQSRLLDRIAHDPAIAAVGIAPAPDGYELKVNVSGKPAHGVVPPEVDGVTVRVESVRRVRAR